MRNTETKIGKLLGILLPLTVPFPASKNFYLTYQMLIFKTEPEEVHFITHL